MFECYCYRTCLLNGWRYMSAHRGGCWYLRSKFQGRMLDGLDLQGTSARITYFTDLRKSLDSLGKVERISLLNHLRTVLLGTVSGLEGKHSPIRKCLLCIWGHTIFMRHFGRNKTLCKQCYKAYFQFNIRSNLVCRHQHKDSARQQRHQTFLDKRSRFERKHPYLYCC